MAVISIVSLSACSSNPLAPNTGQTSELSQAYNTLYNRGFASVGWTGYSDGSGKDPKGYSFEVKVKNCPGKALVNNTDVTVQIADSKGKNQTLSNASAVQVRQDKRFKYCAK